ncbi:MAG: DUF99 family protein [Desulfurococcaceae archaeon]
MQSKVEAYDDGFFPPHYKGGKGYTYIAGVCTQGPNKVLRIAWSTVKVDGNTTMNTILELTKILKGEVIILDGVTYAGFDSVDPDVLTSSTGKATIVVLQYPLNLSRIEKALKKHFEDWMERFRVIRKVYENSIHVATPWKTIRIYATGVGIKEALEITRKLCIYSPIPEPLRIAHTIASALSRLRMSIRP